MFKILWIIGISIATFSLGFASASFPLTTNLSGQWDCFGYDMHDGMYRNAMLILTLDAKTSVFENDYSTYHFCLTDSDSTVYLGEVAANGNTAAVYFENTSSKMPTDRGVGIATITHDLDQNNKVTTVLHKFYYEPTYGGGGNGYETCVKSSL